MSRHKKRALPDITPTVTIERLSHEGRGVAHVDGKIVFIEEAMPGETVQFKYVARHGKYDEGLAVSVENPSPDRVPIQCPHHQICGGCSMQHISSAAQINMKQGILLEQLAHFGNVDVPTILAPLTAHPWGYRRSARMGVKFVPNKGALVGFREKRSHFLATLNECHVLHPKVAQLLQPLKDLVATLDAKSQLPQMEVSVGDEAVAFVLRHLQALSEHDVTALTEFSQQHQVHFYLQPGGRDTVHKLWPQEGEDRLHYRLDDFDLTMQFHPMDFTQINADINRQMINRAIELLDPQAHESVLDLFCGLGNFTLPLARKAKRVVGVEGDEAMVLRGRENAAANGLTNVEFYGANLVKDLPAQPWVGEGFDKILIDPPRSGALEVVQELARFKAKRVVYVSCNPATLARDAGELTKLGYHLTQAGVMDMFPHTTHVESIAVFELK